MTPGSWIYKVIMLFIFSFSFSPNVYSGDRPFPVAYTLELKGPIGPAAVDFLSKAISQATAEKGSLLAIILDTPGGLDRSMRQIIAQIIRSPLPIVTYVAPSGARAASAGTYILYASHIAAMAPGTNVGAATPITMGLTHPTPTQERKLINDASAYIKSLAEMRGRNAVWAVKAVTQGSSLSAKEALSMKVIDYMATDLTQLLHEVNGQVVEVQSVATKLDTVGVVIKHFAPDWRTRFLGIITDPNIAYILLLIGVYGLLFEFLNPGFVLPGVAGLICLLVAFYAFQLLPINYVGLALILVGMGFILAEAFLPSFGTLGIGGIIAFIIGSILLFDRNVPGFSLLIPVIVAVTLVTVGFLVVIIQLALRSQRRPIVSGREELIGSEGEVVILKGDEERPRARIRGELWQIRSNVPLRNGDRIKVLGIDELILNVVPIEGTPVEGGRTA